ncbi:MAG TPA: lytic murein transglycosylase [Alphaproteobacteria bacterium]|nr:lytic murein transglycosylase [Alphaproteobacteria bacterium]
MKKLRLISAFVLMFGFLLPNIVFSADKSQTPPKAWMIFLDNLKQEMLAKGISPKTIEKAYGKNSYYHPKPEVVAQDQKQAEFILTSRDYLNRLVSESRVAHAREHYKDLNKKYKKVEDEFGVPLNFLTAFWAVETNFGQNKGKYHLIDGLTNLSYKNRRSKFFKNELYNVLKIMDTFDLENDKMLGSWAGAMGHFQFMPSTYNAYAIDYDGDGVVDIWDSFDDAIGSAANYLKDLGWKIDEPWGEAVKLPWNFDYTLTGYKTRKTVEEWIELGVLKKNGKALDLNKDLKASIIIPDGRKGQPYLILGNFRRIMIWNRSENYALAVSLLADYVLSQAKYQPISSERQYALTNKDIEKVQKFANRILHTHLKVDGKLGPKTKEAVKKLQAKAKMHQDGYPDYQLLKKIDNYNTKIGFHVPVQPKKAKKK